MSRLHSERHLIARVGWLRAAVLGANDGIVSTASLIVGVAAAAQGRGEIFVAGGAGLVAGAMSMAAGEYVSVSSQADTESADLARETSELATQPDSELNELAGLYAARGVEPALARQVAQQLMAKDALAAHARDELGIRFMTQQPATGDVIGVHMGFQNVLQIQPQLVQQRTITFVLLMHRIDQQRGASLLVRDEISECRCRFIK